MLCFLKVSIHPNSLTKLTILSNPGIASVSPFSTQDKPDLMLVSRAPEAGGGPVTPALQGDGLQCGVGSGETSWNRKKVGAEPDLVVCHIEEIDYAISLQFFLTVN